MSDEAVISSMRVNRDVRAFVARQLAIEVAAGAKLAAAAQTVRAALPDDFQWALGDIERTLAGGPAPTGWGQLERLMRAARDNGIDPDRTFAAYEKSAHESRAPLEAVLAGSRSIGIYLTALVTILVIVLGVYAMFVLPQFASMFQQFGATLPGFTAATIGNTWVLLPLLALVVFGMVVWLVGVSRLRRRIRTLEPVEPVLGRIPGLGGWAREYDAALWMRYTAIFLDAGGTEGAARNAAASLVGVPHTGHLPRMLDAASKLGRLRPELAYLLELDAREAVERLERPRNAFVLAFRLIIYFIVAGYVLAMYLPIFKLGAVV